ncbi:MAG TPA: ribonuclease III [Polyangiaceae bacterium]
MSAPESALTRIASLAGLPLDSPGLLQALTHPSLANELGVPHNQRLEFLGDAVLGLCASEELYRLLPDADEGTLTRQRAQLVNAQALAAWAREAGLPSLLRLGRGALAAGLHGSTNVLADAVEALIAAAYLEVGLDAARRLSDDIVRHGLRQSGAPGGRDPKSELQERLQALGHPAPSYELIETSGPAHERRFRVKVIGRFGALGEGEGRSKRTAEQAAAASALSRLSAEALTLPPERPAPGEPS